MKLPNTIEGQWEMAIREPVQTPLRSSEPDPPITLETADATWRMIPRADYRIAARVLHDSWYDDWQATVVPVDLALGWGTMSEPKIDKWIEWRQSNRWYYYRLRKSRLLGNVISPLSRDYVREHSANVHIIPATASIEEALQSIERNTFVMLEGMLVDVEVERHGTVQRFATSLSRTDGGDGSCEIMYVVRLVTKGRG